jgi:hypothetical protein
MNWIDANGKALRDELSGSGEATLVVVREMGGTLDTTPARCSATTQEVPACQKRSAAR